MADFRKPTILGLHSKGEDVLSLQQNLMFLGHDVPLSGIFDEPTKSAVEKIQQETWCSGGVDLATLELISQKAEHKRTLLERGSGGEESEEYEIDSMTSNPIRSIPVIDSNSTSRGGWKPDTIILGYTGTIGPEHSAALLNIKGILSAHYIVWEEVTGKCVPIEKACWLGGYSSDHSLPYRSVVILIENFGPLSGNKEQGWHHALFPEVKYDSQVLGEPIASFSPKLGNSYWQPFASSQIDAVKVLCKRLIEDYSITRVIGMAEALVGSTSPGPAFPLQEVLDYLFPKEQSDV